MNVFEATSKLFGWFDKNNSFEYDKDYKKLKIITENELEERGAITLALQALKDAKLISDFTHEGRTLWILNKPFYLFDQNVNISGAVALHMSSIINEFCELTGETSHFCDPKEITEQNIQTLLTICQLFAERLKTLENGDEKDDTDDDN